MNAVHNCHIRGLDSIVIATHPDGRPKMRAFVATPEHQLWRGADAIAFHTHRSDITLVHLWGGIANIMAHVTPRQGELTLRDTSTRAWRHVSHLRTGMGRFEPVKGSWGHQVRTYIHAEKARCFTNLWMPATQLHTVWLCQGQTAAWLVLEGAIDPTYDPVVYTNTDLTDWSPSGLYQPMAKDRAALLHERVMGAILAKGYGIYLDRSVTEDVTKID